MTWWSPRVVSDAPRRGMLSVLASGRAVVGRQGAGRQGADTSKRSSYVKMGMVPIGMVQRLIENKASYVIHGHLGMVCASKGLATLCIPAASLVGHAPVRAATHTNCDLAEGKMSCEDFETNATLLLRTLDEEMTDELEDCVPKMDIDANVRSSQFHAELVQEG